MVGESLDFGAEKRGVCEGNDLRTSSERRSECANRRVGEFVWPAVRWESERADPHSRFYVRVGAVASGSL